MQHREVPGQGVPRGGVTDAGYELLGLLPDLFDAFSSEGEARGQGHGIGVPFSVAFEQHTLIVALALLGCGRDLRAVTSQDTLEGLADHNGHRTVFMQHLMRVAAGACGHEHPVHVGATRHRHVQQLARFLAPDQRERGVHGLALRAVDGGGIPQVDAGSDVLGRQRDDGAEAFVAGPHRPVIADGTDLPAVAVLHEVGQAQRQVTVVLAGDDDVTHPGTDPVVQARFTGGVDDSSGDLVGAGAVVQRIDGVVAERQHQRRVAALVRLLPLGVHAGFEVAFTGDAGTVVVEVEPDGHRVSFPQRQCRGRFGRIGEAHEFAQRDRAGIGGDVPQHPTTRDGRELLIVTDQAHHRVA